MAGEDRVRFHQYVRPRYQNPTFFSNNVGASIGIISRPTIDLLGLMSRRNSLPILPKLPQKANIDKAQTPKKSSRSSSRLSQLGSKSLKKTNIFQAQLLKKVSDRDIYEKQRKQFDIISLAPVVHTETIKKYPKLHLQNSKYSIDINLALLHNQMLRKGGDILTKTNPQADPEEGARPPSKKST